VLRPWDLSDADAVMEAFGDLEIQRWHVRRADSVGEARQWITRCKAGWAEEAELNWALVDRASDSLMGRVSLKGVDLHNGAAAVAYWMVRGRGICSQPVIALCQWAFDDAGFHRIGLAHSVANVAPCRVAAKAGFRAEGIRRDAATHADDWHDMHEHALLARQRVSRMTISTAAPWARRCGYDS
jgi:ribosomal-protein-alanine N-acetyltransferase